MRHSWKLIWTLTISLIVVVALGLIVYRMNQSFQDTYRQKASDGIVNLLQKNPYDQVSVVVIVIDGLRYEEGLGAEGKYLNHIWNDLRPQGTLLTNYHIGSPTATTSVHTALVSGRVSTVPNDGHIRPIFPTMLEYYRDSRSDYVETELKQILQPGSGIFRPDSGTMAEIGKLADEARTFGPEKTALYLGKDLIYSLGMSSSGRIPSEEVFQVNSLRDIEVEEFFKAKIPDVKPNMIFVNLADVDEAGHEAEWYYYVDAIRAADKLVYEMWLALQAQTKYRDKTYFIVTTDHGRHDPAHGGYPHHSCFCDGCRHSFMMLLGPGIKKDFVSDQPHSEIDLVPTVGAVTGVAMPGSTGKPIIEAFENPDALPKQRQTSLSLMVEGDKKKVDERDTEKILLDKILSNPPINGWGNNTETAMLYLAAAARIDSHADEATALLQRLPVIDEGGWALRDYPDLKMAYPMMVLGRSNENSGATMCFGYAQRGQAMFDKLKDTSLLGNWEPGSTPVINSMEDVAFTSAMLAAAGRLEQEPRYTRDAYILLLDTLGRLESYDKVWTPGLDQFINTYKYRQGPNNIFTQREVSMRDRMWILWGIERTLAEADPAHVPTLQETLERQYRLLVAFCNEWQDSSAMIGGTGKLDDKLDMVSQGLSLASIADFKPWRRWELDELGYSPTIYATPLFDFPPQHFFYILGQANALAGAWTTNERLKLFVNDNGSIRGDLLDKNPAISPSDPEYTLDAVTMLYGFDRFDKADFNMFDLELYPIVHQMDTLPVSTAIDEGITTP